VQHHHGAAGRPVGLQNVGAVEVLLEVAGIDRAAGEVAVAGYARCLVDPVDDLPAHVAEDLLFVPEVRSPVALVDVGGMQVVRHIGVPYL